MKSVNDFIKELQAISPEKRKLPIVITCPNGLQLPPQAKMQTQDFVPAMAGGIVSKIVISWE